MLYSCTHMATVGVKGLKCISKYPCSFDDPSQVPNALHQQSLTHSEDVDEFWNKTGATFLCMKLRQMNS